MDTRTNKYQPLTSSHCTRKLLRVCIGLLLLNLVIFLVITSRKHQIIQQPLEEKSANDAPSFASSTLLSDDYKKLIGIPFSFKYIPDSCINLTSNYIVAIHSAPGNVAKRQAIRETWGSAAATILFVVGTPSDAKMAEQLEDEIYREGDFIQGDFVDSYRNLTYKHVMLFKFMVYYCANVDYLIKVDDDAFVNVPNMEDFLQQYHVKYNNSTDILCNALYNAPVLRKGKWAVSKEEYPKDRYPTYCLGYSVIFPINTVFLLYVAVQEAPYFWIDDVHITGILAEKIGLKHKHLINLVIPRALQDKIAKTSNFKEIIRPFLFANVNISIKDMRTLWTYVVKYTPKTSILAFIENR